MNNGIVSVYPWFIFEGCKEREQGRQGRSSRILDFVRKTKNIFTSSPIDTRGHVKLFDNARENKAMLTNNKWE